MPLPYPRLDDRTFEQLVSDGLARASAVCPDWTDHGPGDPGVTLVEVFAFLTESMLYRLNRVPQKLHLALLNLAGLELRAPSAAAVTLTFSRSGGSGDPITIPAGTQVTSGDGAVSFVTTQPARLAKGVDSVEAPALACGLVEAETLGIATGQPGQSLVARQSPVIAPSGDGSDFSLGVEMADGEDAEGSDTLGVGDRRFRIWREVESFAGAGPSDLVYRLDRASGRVRFAPAVDVAWSGGRGVGALPPAGREIRAWYRTGGGRAGNVAAGALTTLKNAPPGVAVTNKGRAAGGADAETVDEILARAPATLSAAGCAVTAGDFENVALSVGGVARARAYAQAQAWAHAAPGAVETLVMPRIDATPLPDGAITSAVVVEHRREELLKRVATALDAKKPLGVRALASWARVRPVSVSARVAVGREVDPDAVAAAVRRRVNALLSPLRDTPFGAELRSADIYESIMAQPGVRYADALRFTIGEAPDRDVNAIVRDPHQRACWHAAADGGVYRSLDDGDSWSLTLASKNAKMRFVRPHRGRPGLIAVGAARDAGSVIHVSPDAGETWTEAVASFDCEAFDADWIERDGGPLLLIATAKGLRQFAPGGDSGPVPVVVDKALDTKGFYAVAAASSPSGVSSVAVAARGEAGVYLSTAGGVSETYRPIGLKEKDVRSLVVQSVHARDFLWAGVFAEAGEQGEGAFRLELRASGEDDPDGFQPINVGWQGGSCQSIAFADALVFAGSNRAGALWMDSSATSPTWTSARLDAGLPIRDAQRLLHVVTSVAAAPVPGGPPILFAAGSRGVYRSVDRGERFELSSATIFTERIPLPPDWLYCAGEHAISVVVEDGA